MARDSTDPDNWDEETLVLPRSRLKRLSLPEKIAFGFLLLAIGAYLVRPVYVWTVKRRAARLYQEVLSLQGSQALGDWMRLLELKNVSLRGHSSRVLSWFLYAADDTLAACETSVRGPAEAVLREAVFQDTSSTLKALTCNNVALSEWASTCLMAEFNEKRTRAAQGPSRRDTLPEACKLIVEACLSGNTAAREYVISHAPSVQMEMLRCEILLAIARRDEKRAYPLVREFLARRLDPTSTPNAITTTLTTQPYLAHWLLSVGRWFLPRTTEADLPLAGRLVQALLQPGITTIRGSGQVELVREYLMRAGPEGAGVLEEGLASMAPPIYKLVIFEAANARLLSPQKLWVQALDSLDERCRILAARMLGCGKATEAADDLARRLNDPSVEFGLQVAWSLLAMGDARGRKALRQWSTDDVTQCRDLPDVFALPWMGRGSPPQVQPTRTYPLSRLSQAILEHVGAGGTMPLTISPWPGSARRFEGRPVLFQWY